MLSDFREVAEALVRQLKHHVQQAEGPLQPSSITAIAGRDEALVLEHGSDRAGTLVAEEVADVLSWLCPPEGPLVGNHPAERELLDVLDGIHQEQAVPVPGQKWRFIAHCIADRHADTLVRHAAKLLSDHGLKLWKAFAAEDAQRHAVCRVAGCVQLDHLLVEVEAELPGLVAENSDVAARHMEGVVGVGAHVHDANIPPPRLGAAPMELRVNGVDFAVRAVPRQQGLREEA
mmetsp:Transcript_39331/g.117657  ORF Transcript_39331/g.117657 Transcript_39331/m.117657 type:complete len:232 (+) Transcript_39331:2060-2755(+)